MCGRSGAWRCASVRHPTFVVPPGQLQHHDRHQPQSAWDVRLRVFPHLPSRDRRDRLCGVPAAFGGLMQHRMVIWSDGLVNPVVDRDGRGYRVHRVSGYSSMGLTPLSPPAMDRSKPGASCVMSVILPARSRPEGRPRPAFPGHRCAGPDGRRSIDRASSRPMPSASTA